jgi:N-acetylglutamate synthase-like GNAT family acetyltransferase
MADETKKAPGSLNIVGKVVTIRRATMADLDKIRGGMEKYHFHTEDLNYSDFVVATENGTMLGFGRLQKIGDLHTLNSVVVLEDLWGEGIGTLIIKHLLRIALGTSIYVLTDLVEYFEKQGFIRVTKNVTKLREQLMKSSTVRGKRPAVLVYKKKKKEQPGRGERAGA